MVQERLHHVKIHVRFFALAHLQKWDQKGFGETKMVLCGLADSTLPFGYLLFRDLRERKAERNDMHEALK